MKKYFLRLNNQTVGPYSWHELKAMNLAPTTPVWFEGLDNWRNANDVGELQSLFNASPNPFSQQPNPYVPPKTRSTTFSQMDYSSMEPTAKKSGSKVGLIIGIVVALFLAGGIFFAYRIVEKKRRFSNEIQFYVDSLNLAESIMNAENKANDSINQEIAVEEVVADPSALPSDYTGRFTNYAGATIRILGGGNDLQIKLKLTDEAGSKCAREIFGTGSFTSTEIITMQTKEGCTIKLRFSGKDVVSIEESSECDSFHGTKCSFVGVYIRE